jgi:hypothetical protein
MVISMYTPGSKQHTRPGQVEVAQQQQQQVQQLRHRCWRPCMAAFCVRDAHALTLAAHDIAFNKQYFSLCVCWMFRCMT